MQIKLYIKYILLKSIDLYNDTVIASVNKVVKIKSFITNRLKWGFVTLPIFVTGTYLLSGTKLLLVNIQLFSW